MWSLKNAYVVNISICSYVGQAANNNCIEVARNSYIHMTMQLEIAIARDSTARKKFQ